MVMKKTVILLILTLMMVVSGMCYAAGDGSDLNRQQKVADKFMAVLSGDAAAVHNAQRIHELFALRGLILPLCKSS